MKAIAQKNFYFILLLVCTYLLIIRYKKRQVVDLFSSYFHFGSCFCRDADFFRFIDRSNSKIEKSKLINVYSCY